MMLNKLTTNALFTLNDINDKALSKMSYAIFFILSVSMIFIGVSGIIEFKSPDSLGSLAMLSSAFFNHFEYHVLIILGALIFTLSVWFIRKNPQ